MRTGAASAASAIGARHHNENDVTMTVAGLWRYYSDWRHVATGCTAVVFNNLQMLVRNSNNDFSPVIILLSVFRPIQLLKHCLL